MTIYIDADACPVTRIAEKLARQYSIPVTLLCDTNHVLTSDYSTIRVIGAGADAVDIALINLCQRDDIVVTQDYGVAALALGKGARAIHQSGKWYTDDNIDGLLMERHLAKKARCSGKHHLKGQAKRTEEDDRHFSESFERMIQEALNCPGRAVNTAREDPTDGWTVQGNYAMRKHALQGCFHGDPEATDAGREYY